MSPEVDRPRTLRRIVTPGVCAIALLGSLALILARCTPTPSAAELLRRVNGAYDALRPIPRQVDMTFHTKVAVPGQPPTVTRGQAKILQVQRKARFETLPGTMKFEAASPEGPKLTDAGELVWVHDGRVLRTRYTLQNPSPGGPPIVQETYIDHDRVPEELGSRYTDPMAEPELATEIVAHPFTLTRENWNGKSMYVLRSQGEIVISDTTRMQMNLWVDPDDLLVRRTESDTTYVEPGTGTPRSTWMEAELVYHLNVPLTDSDFELKLGPDAKDMTEALLQEGRSKAQAKP